MENKIYNQLKKIITNPVCELNFKNHYQLLVAVILSAQCTDKRVNQVTEKLFKKYPSVFDLAKANISDVKQIIKPCGFYNTKGVNIVSASKDIVEKFNGVVPSDMDKLLSLKGVGRKTANVVRAVGFKIPSIAVDTHVFRVSKRLNLTKANDVDKCEKDLMKIFDKNEWINLHHTLLLFGRYYCKAQKPMCDKCDLKQHCKFYKERKN